jgi:PAS domain S-box-containing protein
LAHARRAGLGYTAAVRLRTHLLVLVLVALVPVLVFSAGVVIRDIGEERRAVEQGLTNTARALTAAIDRHVTEATRTLEAVTVTPRLVAGDLRGFHEVAAAVVRTQPSWQTMFLLDVGGQAVVHTARPFGEPLPSAADRDYFRAVVATGRPAVSDYLVGRVTGDHAVVVAVPVVRDGRLREVLGAAIGLEGLSRLLAEQRLPPDWTVAVLDRHKRIIGRSRTPERFIGQPATTALAGRSGEAREGTFRDSTKEGEASFGVFNRSALSGWTVVLGVPAAVVDAAWQRLVWLMAGSGLAVLLVGGGLALLVARRIARPIAGLERATGALRSGEPLPPLPPMPVTEMRGLARALREAGEARRRAEESLRVTLASIGDGVIATDVTGHVTFMNAAAETLTGWTAAEALDRPLDEVFVIVNEETRRPVESPVAKVLRENRVVGLANHTVMIPRGGGARPIDDSGAPIRDAAGHVIGVVLVFHDISDRRHAEALRQESERRFRLMADGAPVMIWLAGADGARTFFNSQWLRFTGRTLGDARGEGWADGVHPDDAGRVIEVYRAAVRARRPFALEYRLRRHDGVYRWAVDHGVALVDPDGTFTGYVGAALEIHDRRVVEEERSRRLREATEAREEAERSADLVRRLQGVTDAALARLPLDDLLAELLIRVREVVFADTAAVLLLDETGRTLVTRAAAGLEEGVARGVRIPVGAGFAGRIAADRRPVIIGDVDHAEILNPLLREKGVRSLLGVPLTTGGRVIGVLHVGTRRPRAFGSRDAELLQLVADRVALAIEHTLLYEAERRARAEAEAASRAKDDFLATLSHELRTPLTAILGWARILRRGDVPAAQAAHAVDVIERNAVAQSRLIEDLLDVSRIITGRVRLDVQPVRLVPVVDAALDGIRPAAEAKSITLAFEPPPAPDLVMADAARLQQVVWNLVSNAVKFTPHGGRVEIGLERTASHQEIRVEDTGVGIRPEVLPFVFDRFRQADSTSTRVHGGLGLGLAIVRHLVELHGGSVTADSAGEGRGARFIVRIPIGAVAVSRPAGERPPEAARHGATTLRGLRVLVVDDEPDARELVSIVLRGAGAEVLHAATATEALTLIERDRPDVLISDIAMPGRDGYDLIREVRRSGDERAGLPALALTAYARHEDRERALAAGYHRYAAKPVDPEALTREVARLAGRAA